MGNTVKIYGCRHSGTRYIRKLFPLNWHVEMASNLTYGSKHKIPKIELPDDVSVIIIHKHPAAYIASLRSRYWGSKLSTNILIDNWVNNHLNWLKLKQSVIIKHEDLLFDFDNTMCQIEFTLGLVPKYEKYKNIFTHCGKSSQTVNRKFYKEKEYLRTLSQKDLEVITNIPNDLMKTLGY
jgi:hypothetical protein